MRTRRSDSWGRIVEACNRRGRWRGYGSGRVVMIAVETEPLPRRRHDGLVNGQDSQWWGRQNKRRNVFMLVLVCSAERFRPAG